MNTFRRADLKPALDQNLLGHYAGFISRFLSFVIDVVMISFTIVATTWFISVTTSAVRLGGILGISVETIPWSKPILDFITGPAVTGVTSALFIFGYHVFFWVVAGQTPGKALIGLRLVTISGGRVSPLRAALRFAAYFVSGIPIYLGFLWVLLDDRRQAWHDKIAGTLVIYTWAARPDELFLKEEIGQVSSGVSPSFPAKIKDRKIVSQETGPTEQNS
jgi:uncharacterized RDD family membrane protein YckC